MARRQFVHPWILLLLLGSATGCSGFPASATDICKSYSTTPGACDPNAPAPQTQKINKCSCTCTVEDPTSGLKSSYEYAGPVCLPQGQDPSAYCSGTVANEEEMPCVGSSDTRPAPTHAATCSSAALVLPFRCKAS